MAYIQGNGYLLRPHVMKCKTWHKKDIGLIIRLVTGHGPFRYHISKCEPDQDPICDLCEEDDQTANHLILECPALSGIRRDNTEFSSVITNISPAYSGNGYKDGGTTGLCS